jgi:7-keto-8-aminopelargonate synthetase-like enzyme
MRLHLHTILAKIDKQKYAVMKHEFAEQINSTMNKLRDIGLIQLNLENESFDGKHIIVKGKEYNYFASCSYMGLETDPRLKKASIEAIEKFGTQFSCSRTSAQLGMYEELESLLGEIFGKPTLLAATTTLGHASTIPIMIAPTDAVLVDAQTHNSVKNAVQMVKPDGVVVETIKHNRMDYLETRIQILRQNHDKIWYMLDGIYSMLGDPAPLEDLKVLLDRYEQLHLYVDDAHGMGWTGKHGRGYTLSKMEFHPRMILTSSLAKAFGSSGGALVFNDEKSKEFVRNCGSSLIFSGPIQPAVLAASIASAKIHLTDEIDAMQNELYERMFYFNQNAVRLGLPLVSTDMNPIKFIGTGSHAIGYKLSQYLMNEGFFVNFITFPIVPNKFTGLRIVLTRHHTIEEIGKLLNAIAYALPKFIAEENYSMDQIHEAFGMVGTVPKQTVTEQRHLKIA